MIGVRVCWDAGSRLGAAPREDVPLRGGGRGRGEDNVGFGTSFWTSRTYYPPVAVRHGHRFSHTREGAIPIRSTTHQKSMVLAISIHILLREKSAGNNAGFRLKHKLIVGSNVETHISILGTLPFSSIG